MRKLKILSILLILILTSFITTKNFTRNCSTCTYCTINLCSCFCEGCECFEECACASYCSCS